MAEVSSSSTKDTFSKASPVTTATSIVAQPKFVFGSGMSERVKKSDGEEDDDSDVSEKEEQLESGDDLLECASAALKRSADSEDDSADFSCPDFLYAPRKMLKTENTDKPASKIESVLRPSALSDIANKLTTKKHCGTDDVKKSGILKKDDKSAKTFGESSSSCSSSSESSTNLLRQHVIDTPAPLNVVGQSENYFQQFLTGNSLTSSMDSKGAFVFGENLRDRVNVEQTDSADSPAKGPKVKEGGSPQSLAELADKGNTTSIEVAQSSIAAAAQKYESEHSPKKQKLAEVHVMTGEEDERNVIQVNCRLFTFCKDTHAWLGRGRVILKLNDHCQLDSDGTFHSRLVARTQGSLRLVLNTKLWPDMVVEKASEKAVRVSAMEDGHIQLYLVMAQAREVIQLYTAIERRIRTLKRDQLLSQEDDRKEEKKSDEKTFSKTIDDDGHQEMKKDAEEEKLAKQTTLPDSPSESEKN